ncbi:MAG: hypothetical protein ACREJM_14020, partial [Candidatus Saccharimonadales bacterium]
RFDNQPDAILKILRAIGPLVGNVRRIVHHDIERGIVARHISMIGENVRPVNGIDIHADDLSSTPAPKAALVDGCVEYLLGFFFRIKAEHSLEQFGIVAIPNRGQRLVGIFFDRQRFIRITEEKSVASVGLLFGHDTFHCLEPLDLPIVSDDEPLGQSLHIAGSRDMIGVTALML